MHFYCFFNIMNCVWKAKAEMWDMFQVAQFSVTVCFLVYTIVDVDTG
jgi:hypothetical protein